LFLWYPIFSWYIRHIFYVWYIWDPLYIFILDIFVSPLSYTINYPCYPWYLELLTPWRLNVSDRQTTAWVDSWDAHDPKSHFHFTKPLDFIYKRDKSCLMFTKKLNLSSFPRTFKSSAICKQILGCPPFEKHEVEISFYSKIIKVVFHYLLPYLKV
jgi:hypothetical protein